ncbi:MAG TPA: PBP1A family penicillin-binding protein [Vicinamibacteria bacterium]|nr:PBP1A family penicillin-binding protein [Vicinamibacteria bacterium]
MSTSKGDPRRRVYSNRRLKVAVLLLTLLSLPLVALFGFTLWVYVRSSALVDARLEEARNRVPTRVYSRPVSIRTSDRMDAPGFASILNALSYQDTDKPEPGPGEFRLAEGSVTVRPRGGAAESPGPATPAVQAPVPPVDEAVVVTFEKPKTGGEIVKSIRTVKTGKDQKVLTLEPALISYLFEGEEREKRRFVKYDELPRHLVESVLAIEDRRFFQHPGFDPFRIVGAALRNLKPGGNLQGGSTLTQQFVKNFFLTPDRTPKRKIQEAVLSFVLERRASKKEIFELYVNEIYLGQVGSFNINGMGEAARVYFQKDISNLSVTESALLAGMIQSPNPYNPMRHPDRAQARRNTVLRGMADEGFISGDDLVRLSAEPVEVRSKSSPGLDAPYFIDLVRRDLKTKFGESGFHNLKVESTLDLRLQRVAQGALETGLTELDAKLKRPDGMKLQGALISLDVKTGGIVALVGGRSYTQSQFNRAVQSQRQPGSTFKPFVYLAAFEATLDDPALPPITPATVVDDSPYVFFYEDKEYIPQNFENEYLGPVTLRRALSKSLNVATLKVAEMIGYARIADLWRDRMKISKSVKAVPSVALGSFEVSPLEMATAYEILASGGFKREPFALYRASTEDGTAFELTAAQSATRVVRQETTYLVTRMMESVLNEGTGAAARSMGFTVEAAGKSGTTNDTRDAWFAGFTPDIVTIVWVGYDDNSPVNLPGSRAALPIWTEFMKAAVAGLGNRGFLPPEEGVVFVNIDKTTGKRANPNCGKVFNESFLVGTEPMDEAVCPPM